MYHSIRVPAILLCAFALTHCGGGEKPAETVRTGPVVSADLVNGATISGKVAFTGTAPAPKPIDMSANPQCERTHKDHPVTAEDIVVNPNHTLRNVFVWIKSGLPALNWAVPSTPATIDQKFCMYHPHVLGVMVGQNVAISNDDPVNHNIHPVPQVNEEWNDVQSPGDPPQMRSFAKQEIMVPIKCNVHPWMRAYVGVVSHPFFAVTGDDGSFTIKGMPPGTYTVQAWHEKLGTQEVQVTVGAKESKAVDFSYKE
ncbi:MAG: carboxypeptidase regulatory-like domain-containing protein [Acidobacteria bacterium]|nr:carboxypeptidase regulatory-like domain-containing protein [Acidobacteriota bacterium]